MLSNAARDLKRRHTCESPWMRALAHAIVELEVRIELHSDGKRWLTDAQVVEQFSQRVSMRQLVAKLQESHFIYRSTPSVGIDMLVS